MDQKALSKPRKLQIIIVTIALLVSLLPLSFYWQTKTAIGPLHPLFTFIKIAASKSTENSFIQALESGDSEALKTYRDTIQQFYQISGGVKFNGEINSQIINTATHKLQVKIYTPAERLLLGNGRTPVVIYFHGGGYSSGSISAIEKLAKTLANESRSIVITPAYRLAPEHRYPAALQDAYAALTWASKNVHAHSGSRSRIFVAGDSAGGNLAATVVLYSRDHQGPNIRGQILIYPDVSPLQHPFDDEISNIGIPPSIGFVTAVGETYAGAARKDDPYLSPLLASNLNNLPPAYVITAGFDVLSTEGKRYAQRLKDAGNTVLTQHEAGLGHGFISMVGLLEETDQALKEIGRFVQSNSM
jgi:acetyl esterase